MLREGALLKRIKVGVGALLMLGSMMISDRVEVLLLYILSATLHELGHLGAAGVLGIGIREIRFEFSGVRICTEEKLTSYKNELRLAMAGPLVNFVCVTVCVAFFSCFNISLNEASALTENFLVDGYYSHVGAVGFFAIASLLQGCVNLLPVKTFDGGRICYCAIAMLCREKAAARALDIFSAFSAFLLWTVALYLMLKLSAGLGIYVFAVCIFLSTLKDTDYISVKDKKA